MTRWVIWAVVVVVFAVVGLILFLALTRVAEQPSAPVSAAETEPGASLRAIRLHFPSPDRIGWRTEDRVVPSEEGIEALAERITRELLNGPAEGPAVWSNRVEVRAFFLTEDGVGVLDLSPHLLTDWPRGDAAEWVVVGSIVRSLAESVPGLRSLQILVGGEVVGNPPGSIPLDLPLRPEWFAEGTPEEMR